MKERHNVSDTARRGFYQVDRPQRSTVYVRKGWHLVECDGEAHSNPFIDNCYVCAPLWGDVAVPDWVTGMEHYRDAAAAVRALSRWLGYDGRAARRAGL